MLSQASYAEHPRADTILSSHSHHHVPDRPLTLAMGYSSPWSGLRTEEDYRALVAETSDEMFQTMIDQSMLLNVPSNPRSRGTGGTRRSFSTVHSSYTTSSDDRSDMNHEQIETRRGGREQGMKLAEDGVLNVRQVRDVGACIRCRTLRMKVSLVIIWILHLIRSLIQAVFRCNALRDMCRLTTRTKMGSLSTLF